VSNQINNALLSGSIRFNVALRGAERLMAGKT
jgi:hypothetical protein